MANSVCLSKTFQKSSCSCVTSIYKTAICILHLLRFSIFCFLTRPYCGDRDKRLTQMVAGWGSPESPQHITQFPPSWEHLLHSYAMTGSSNLCMLCNLFQLHLPFQNLFLVNRNLGLRVERAPRMNQQRPPPPVLCLWISPVGQETHRTGVGVRRKKGRLGKSGQWLIVAETLAPQRVVWA